MVNKNLFKRNVSTDFRGNYTVELYSFSSIAGCAQNFLVMCVVHSEKLLNGTTCDT